MFLRVEGLGVLYNIERISIVKYIFSLSLSLFFFFNSQCFNLRSKKTFSFCSISSQCFSNTESWRIQNFVTIILLSHLLLLCFAFSKIEEKIENICFWISNFVHVVNTDERDPFLVKSKKIKKDDQRMLL